MKVRKLLIPIISLMVALPLVLTLSSSIPEDSAYADSGALKTAATSTKINVSRCIVKLPATSYTYNGKAKKPKPKVTYRGSTLKLNKSYTVKYYSNTKAGKARVKITGKGNYTGTKEAYFTIKQVPLKDVSIKLNKNTYDYDGIAKTPSITATYNKMTLKKNKDYTLTYSNNTNAGTATVKVTGKGNYSSYSSLKFTINKIDIASADVSGYMEGYDYTGSAIKPSPTVVVMGRKLVPNTDYTVSYSNNTNVGTATMTINGRGNYMGTVSRNFIIIVPTTNYASSAQLEQSTYTYDKKAHKPKLVSVKAKSGEEVPSRYYDVQYYRGNNVTTDFTTAGLIKVVVSFKTPYAGEITVYETINKAKQTISATTTSKSVTVATLAKAAQSYVMGAKTSGDGALSYTVTTADKNKKMTFSKGTAKIAKGSAKGTYKVVVKVTAKATTNYEEASKSFTLKFVVSK